MAQLYKVVPCPALGRVIIDLMNEGDWDTVQAMVNLVRTKRPLYLRDERSRVPEVSWRGSYRHLRLPRAMLKRLR